MLPWAAKNLVLCSAPLDFDSHVCAAMLLLIPSRSSSLDMEHPGRASGLDMPGRLRRGNYPVWRAILLSVLSQAHPPVRDGTRHCTSPVRDTARQGLRCCLEAPYEEEKSHLHDAKRHLLAPHPLQILCHSQSQCLARCSARMGGRSYPWIFSVGEVPPCGAELESSQFSLPLPLPLQSSGETPPRTRQSGVENADGDSN
ncbi:hypothetical protein V8C35DRAFT_298199 [Trichoderma chlorosporum]